jgi:sugar lactone lactonase YvrE
MAWTFERVAGPFQGPANGVVWDGNAVIFSLMEDQRLMRFDPASGETSEFRKYTNRVNGLAVGRRRELLGCQEGGRRLVEFAADGRMFKVDALLDGKYHNHPSDLAVDNRGRIWFADPHSATLAFGPQIFPPLDHASVLRLEKNDRNAWVVRRITFDTKAPRAVLLSVDEKTLYVAEGEPRSGFVRELRAYPILDDGSVAPCTVLHTFGADHRGPQRGIEGMCLDADGNIVAVGGWRKSGPGPLVHVLSPAGAALETCPLPADMPNRCCFGGKQLDTLYVTTAGGELYGAKTPRRGFNRS